MMANRVMAAYNGALKTRPFAVNATQGCVLFSAGDAIAQSFESRAKRAAGAQGAFPDAPLNPLTGSMDLKRIGVAGCIGVVWSGVLYPAFYGLLERKLGHASLRTVALKSVAEICTMGFLGNGANMWIRKYFGDTECQSNAPKSSEYVVVSVPPGVGRLSQV
jgi:hypothetical protein